MAEDNNADASVVEKGGSRTVTLVSRKVGTRGGYKSVILTYRLKDGLVSRMVLEDKAGTENIYELK